jgi:hypothetical protein
MWAVKLRWRGKSPAEIMVTTIRTSQKDSIRAAVECFPGKSFCELEQLYRAVLVRVKVVEVEKS